MPSRRSVLAFLGLAPITAQAALSEALKPTILMLTAGVDIGVEGVTVAVTCHDFASAQLRCITAAYGLTFEQVAVDFNAHDRFVSTLRLTIADETDPYPSVPAEALHLSRSEAPGGRFLPKTTGRGLRAPVPLGGA